MKQMISMSLLVLLMGCVAPAATDCDQLWVDGRYMDINLQELTPAPKAKIAASALAKISECYNQAPNIDIRHSIEPEAKFSGKRGQVIILFDIKGTSDIGLVAIIDAKGAVQQIGLASDAY